jgi:hypothetical protein
VREPQLVLGLSSISTQASLEQGIVLAYDCSLSEANLHGLAGSGVFRFVM